MKFQNQIRKVIFESLMNESQAFKALEQQLSKVDETFIKFAQDRIVELDKELDSARGEKDFPRFKAALEEKTKVMDELINAHKKRMEILEKMKLAVQTDFEGAELRGEKVFMGENLEYFDPEFFKKGERVRIESSNFFIEVEKMSDDKNQFVLQDFNSEGFKMGDVAVIQNFNIGGDAKMKMYRKFEERYENMGESQINNITSIIKDPA